MGRGTVIESTGSWYKVQSDDGEAVNCRIRGKMRLRGVRSTNPVVVGDRVEFEMEHDGEGNITSIDERTNYIIRRSSNLSKESQIIAANIDRAILVVTLSMPPTSTEFIDRFLVTCEAYHIPPIIALNKLDLETDTLERAETFMNDYRLAGYETVPCSTLTGQGMDVLGRMVASGTTLLSGNSGAGKSSIVKALSPDVEVKVGRISDAHHKGMHTTTFSHVYTLPSGGRIIDTPGIKGFGLIDIASTELWHYFPEFMRIAGRCQYYNCTHTHEPGCAVIEAVENGLIAMSRYENYLKILDEDGKYR